MIKFLKNGFPTEHCEQVVFMQWAKYWLPEELRILIFAVPNGGVRHIGTAKKLRAEGVGKGVPDILFLWARNGYHGLCIEMKSKKGGVVSPEQKTMQASLTKAGYSVHVCRGCDEAQEVLKKYMLTSKE